MHAFLILLVSKLHFQAVSLVKNDCSASFFQMKGEPGLKGGKKNLFFSYFSVFLTAINAETETKLKSFSFLSHFSFRRLKVSW